MDQKSKFSTLPVFLTAISTILGAVMFLRFGFAVGSVGFMGTLLIIFIGHLVTIPTAMALAEIATNQKVEGGGEYFIISRSFGINIGAAIGIALYFSQAISVAFYVIAFAEAFEVIKPWVETYFGYEIYDNRLFSIPALLLLIWLMVKKGADLGMKALYIVATILAISLIFFFAGSTPFGEAFDINRYVLDGIGDPEKAIAGIYFWTWDTEEVLELIKWMRSYNANPDNLKKVKFYGFDPQDPERAARVMLAYLKKVDPNLEEIVRPELGILEVPFSDPKGVGRRQLIPEEYDSLSLNYIQKVMKAFDSKKEAYVASSSLNEWQLAKQHARQIEIYISIAANAGIERDYGQAENIRWTLDYEGEDSKMIVWAHNFHVANMILAENDNEGLDYKGYKCMGFHLKKWYGDQLKIVGLFYNQGEFSALDDNIPSAGFKTFNVGSAKHGSLEHTLINANLHNAYLDLSNIPKNGPIRKCR